MSETFEYSPVKLRTGPRDDGPLALRSPEGRALLLVVAACVAIFLVATFLAADRSVFVDEGMYLANLHENWQAYLAPLRHYNQASPPLVSVAYALILVLADDNLRGTMVHLGSDQVADHDHGGSALLPDYAVEGGALDSGSAHANPASLSQWPPSLCQPSAARETLARSTA